MPTAEPAMVSPSLPGQSCRVDIGIATASRPEMLADTIAFLGGQDRLPDCLFICIGDEADIDRQRLGEYGGKVVVLTAPRGTCSQRNRILSVTDADVMIFMDDDFLPAADFTRQVERLFTAEPSVVVATGQVLADGIIGPGLTFAEARQIVAASRPDTAAAPLSPTYGGYGCNMAIRLAVARRHGIVFDELLPMYGWLEDIDFSRRLAPHGRIVKSSRLRGVHLGTKRSGRSPGRPIGYSQIANPIYLVRKGSLSAGMAWRHMWRNLAANAVRSLKPEPWVDRRGRLRGNLAALLDFATGRLNPARVTSINP